MKDSNSFYHMQKQIGSACKAGSFSLYVPRVFCTKRAYLSQDDTHSDLLEATCFRSFSFARFWALQGPNPWCSAWDRASVHEMLVKWLKKVSHVQEDTGVGCRVRQAEQQKTSILRITDLECRFPNYKGSVINFVSLLLPFVIPTAVC